jgi:hypothetical protein
VFYSLVAQPSVDIIQVNSCWSNIGQSLFLAMTPGPRNQLERRTYYKSESMSAYSCRPIETSLTHCGAHRGSRTFKRHPLAHFSSILSYSCFNHDTLTPRFNTLYHMELAAVDPSRKRCSVFTVAVTVSTGYPPDAWAFLCACPKITSESSNPVLD